MSEFDGDAGHALGRVDGKADRLLGGVEIGDDARLDAARALVADAEHLDRMGAAAQRLARFARLARRQPRDQAADLARSDVEDRDDGRPARQRAHSDSVEPNSLTCSPFPSSAASRAPRGVPCVARAPSSVRRTTSRSASLRSTAAISRERRPFSPSSATTGDQRGAGILLGQKDLRRRCRGRCSSAGRRPARRRGSAP